MKKLKFFLFIISFVIFCVILFSVGYFHLVINSNWGPVISLDSTFIDFGTITVGDPSTKEIQITNKGWTSLQIIKVKPGCAGCITIHSYPQNSIQYGKTGVVTFSLETGTLRGDIMRSFAITSNDKGNPVAIVQVKANVKSPSTEQ
ncbi:MAG: DUF1573 domain-containing protein [Planctomycetaceae bacterium]|jgi:hypothetical protein|nr:DUF1573 domain-containing protein [Planctomycetaceae bacterium]